MRKQTRNRTFIGCFVLLLFLFSVAAPAQQVRVNVYDKFLRQHRIELEPLLVLSTPANKLLFAFSSLSSNLYLQLNGTGWGAATVDQGDPLILLFSNDSTVTITSTALQGYAPGVKESSYKHQYRITLEGLKALSRYDLIGIRKYSFKEFSDMSLPREALPRIRETSQIFLNELNKARLLPSTTVTPTTNGAVTIK